MAKYKQAQLQQNRRSIARGTIGAVAALVLLTAVDVVSLRTSLGFIVVVGFTAAIVWYFFASKNAGNLDGTWVDGWNAEADPNPSWWYPFVAGFVPKSPATRHVPAPDSDTE